MALLFGNFVQPQLILQDLIDEKFVNYHYRIQLEFLAIVTAILLRYHQHPYESLASLYQHLLPMLTSNRRELRHGAMECFTVICSYFNGYQPITPATFEKNESIQLFLSHVERLSTDAAAALRFRLQRNLLPTLTDEGNITPGLVFNANPVNDLDIQFILSVVRKSLSTPQSVHSVDSTITEQSSLAKFAPSNSKLLHLAMPFVTNKSGTNKPVRTFKEIHWFEFIEVAIIFLFRWSYQVQSVC